MGKRIKVQRRGRGTPVFQGAHTGKVAQARYPEISKESLRGTVTDIIHESGRVAPLAVIELANGETFYSAAPEGTHVEQEIVIGADAPLSGWKRHPTGQGPRGNPRQQPRTEARRRRENCACIRRLRDSHRPQPRQDRRQTTIKEEHTAPSRVTRNHRSNLRRRTPREATPQGRRGTPLRQSEQQGLPDGARRKDDCVKPPSWRAQER